MVEAVVCDDDPFVADGAVFCGLPLSGAEDVAAAVEEELVPGLEDELGDGRPVVDDDDRPCPEGLVEVDGRVEVDVVAVGVAEVDLVAGGCVGVGEGARVGVEGEGRMVACSGAGAWKI